MKAYHHCLISISNGSSQTRGTLKFPSIESWDIYIHNITLIVVLLYTNNVIWFIPDELLGLAFTLARHIVWPGMASYLSWHVSGRACMWDGTKHLHCNNWLNVLIHQFTRQALVYIILLLVNELNNSHV